MTYPRSNYARDAAAALTATREAVYGIEVPALTTAEQALLNAQLAVAYEQYTSNLLTYALSIYKGERQDALLAIVEERLGIEKIGNSND